MKCAKTYNMKHGKGKFQVYDGTAVTPKFLTYTDVIISMSAFKTPAVKQMYRDVVVQNQIINKSPSGEELSNQDQITISIIFTEDDTSATTLTHALREFTVNKKDTSGASIVSTLPATNEFIVLGDDGSDQTTCINDNEYFGIGYAVVFDSLTDTADKDFGLNFGINRVIDCEIDGSGDDVVVNLILEPLQRPTEISALPNS